MIHPYSSSIASMCPSVGNAFLKHIRVRLSTCWYRFHCSWSKLKDWRPAPVVSAGVIPRSVGRTYAVPGCVGIAATGGCALGYATTVGVQIPGSNRNSSTANIMNEKL